MASGKEDPCRFGAARLKMRARDFLEETGGVRDGTDPECVHRMRVASRRLRSTLPLFASCFDPEDYRRWVKGFRRIARALGTARDTDVQLVFLDGYERDLPGGTEGAGGIRRIRAFLEKDRQREQEKIVAALDALDRDFVPAGLLAVTSDAAKGRSRVGRGSRRKEDVLAMASREIRTAFSGLLSHGQAVHDPGDIAGHHAVRIAAKKFRYTLEVFRPLYPDRLRPAIDRMKRLQELLGQLHDCDVWIQRLSGTPQGSETGAAPGDILLAISPLSPGDEAGVLALLADRTAARAGTYRQMVAEWEASVPGLLSACLPAGARRLPDRPDGTGKARGATCPAPADAVRSVAGSGSGPDDGHTRQVTRLALLLFDALLPLHRCGPGDRLLLEYAGLLHDIGWIEGQEGHQARSGRMILADRTLPVSPRERAVIALVARYHGKALPGKRDTELADLKKRDRGRVKVLASLLRIADGLDYTHAGRAVSLACTVGPDTVTCTVDFDGDGSTDRSRALAKANLFERVFRRRFVIP